MINQDFNTIIELVKAFPDEQSCIDHLEGMRWNGTVVSPFDPESKVYKCKGNKYRCKNTSKYFNVKTATLFDNTKVQLQKWFMAIWLITGHKKGISSMQLSRDIGVTQKTAWFMLQRIRNCFNIRPETMDTTVEVDETYIGGRESNKHKHKRNKLPQSLNNKATVVGLLERNEKVIAKLVPTPRAKDVLPILLRNIKPESVVMTDQSAIYKRIGGYFEHHVLNHARGEYVRDAAHTNTIEGFWSILKRGIIGIYHFTSQKHLQKYLDEFSFRYNTRTYSECARFNTMLMNIENRLKYSELISEQCQLKLKYLVRTSTR